MKQVLKCFIPLHGLGVILEPETPNNYFLIAVAILWQLAIIFLAIVGLAYILSS